MEKVSFTPDQQNAIGARGGTLLVSAAAGSGKTAVLVERVIQRILDPLSPVDADRLLVVTFTNAAAQEMKSRISSRLEEMSRSDPSNLRLSRQLLLMDQTSISTIDSFCMNLIRGNFQKLDIPPDFRVMDEKEGALLKNEALEEVIEECYRQDDGVFTSLVELLSGGRDDSQLFGAVQQLYQFLRSHAFYEQWLAEQLAAYNPQTSPSETRWAAILYARARDTAAFCLTKAEEALRLCQGDDKLESAYRDALEDDAAYCRHLLDLFGGKPDWDSVYREVRDHAFPRLKALRGYESDGTKERVSELRDNLKKQLGGLEELFCTDSKGFREDIEDLRPKIQRLFEITLKFGRRFSLKKAERRALDFSDLEHYALALLYDTDSEGLHRPSPLAGELSQRYEEILVDEYQDTNEAQDSIFSALAREEGNRFMVGDVKQSIYRFRQAMPELFMEKSAEYTPYDGKTFPAKITLGKNFRSRREITEGVNLLFRELMQEKTAEIQYGKDQELVAGADYPLLEGGNPLPEAVLLEIGDSERDQAEAEYTAEQIARILQRGEKVADHGILRPVQPRDICILMRSPKGRAEKFLQALEKRGIQGWSDSESGFLTSREISVAISLLRAVDNPLLDLPMSAALLSPVFGFTAGELTALRLADKGVPLYRSMTARRESGQGTPKESACLDLLARLRREAAVTDACGLLQKIYDLTDYPSMVQTMPGGETRRANLMLLLDYARQYENAGYRGVSGFLRFVESAQEQDNDLAPAVTISEQANVVRVMSIHRSKGLEFPVVFLCGLSRNFNLSDRNAAALLHPQAGFACKRKDPQGMGWYTTVPREALRLEIARSARAEEMRVLYVAVTRAKERLYLIMAERDIQKELSAALADARGRSGEELAFHISRANSFTRWILLALARHDDILPAADQAGIPLLAGSGKERRFLARCDKWEPAPTEESPAQGLELAVPLGAEALTQRLRTQTAYRYPWAQSTLTPTKLAASEVAQGEKLLRFQSRPQFLLEEGLTPAEKGLALHKFMQFCDYAAARENPAAEVKRLVDKAYLTETEGESIRVKRIAAFFASPLAERIFRAMERDQVRRELRFLSALGERELGRWREDIRGGETVTVQGVADCVFFEEGQAVIVDYKTDYVKDPEELIERYSPQLTIYRMILEKSLGYPVKECVLYSFGLGKEIRIL